MSRPRPRMNVAKHQHRRDGDGCWTSYSMRWRASSRRKREPHSARRRRSRELAKQADGATPRLAPGAALPPSSGKAQCRRLPALALQGVREDVFVQEQGACSPPPSSMPRPGRSSWKQRFTKPEALKMCHVCLRTSWVHAHETHEVMERSLLAFRPDSVSWQVDGAYSRRVPHGNRARSAAKMPRKPHKHGGAVHARGIPTRASASSAEPMMPGEELCRVADRKAEG